MKIFLKIVGVIAVIIVLGIVGLVIFGGKALEQQKRFQAKAMQSEAKINLGMAYINQKSFWAETGVHTSSLLAGNPALPENTIVNYKLGFAKASAMDGTILAQAKQMDPKFDAALFNTDKLGIMPTNEKSKSIDFESLATQHGCLAEANKFKICAIGYVGDIDKVDIWTIDQDRNVVNVVSGVGE